MVKKYINADFWGKKYTSIHFRIPTRRYIGMEICAIGWTLQHTSDPILLIIYRMLKNLFLCEKHNYIPVGKDVAAVASDWERIRQERFMASDKYKILSGLMEEAKATAA